MTRIYLIRHGEAQGNIERVFQGHHDGDISENGLRQLSLLSERCRTFSFDAVYASPLKRALRTAQAANLYHQLPIVTDPALMEINGGCWEGCKWDELPTIYPEQNRIWVYEPWNFAPEGGEPMREVYDRIWQAVTGIVRENTGKAVCVVSHGCVIRNFLCRAMGREIEQINSVPWCDNTAISVIDFNEDLKPTVILLNDASHLDENTSTLNKQSWWMEFEQVRNGDGEQ